MRIILAGLLLGFVLLPGGPSHADGALVMLGGYQLHPKTASIAAGESVTFRVQAGEDAVVPHVIVANDGSFQSPPLEAGQSWTRTFARPGIHRYHLEERSSVEGVIIVE